MKLDTNKKANRLAELPRELNLSSIASISIADLLEIVNQTHRSVLSEDVLNHFGETRPSNGYYSGETKFSTVLDSDGNKLSEGQAKFFKNSKARDKNGNLYVLYHSSPEQFTVFDNDMLGENTGYDNTAFGHFVTDYKPFSERFGENQMKLYAPIICLFSYLVFNPTCCMTIPNAANI